MEFFWVNQRITCKLKKINIPGAQTDGTILLMSGHFGNIDMILQFGQ